MLFFFILNFWTKIISPRQILCAIVLAQEICADITNTHNHTLSAARIRKDATTWSAVSVSAVSRVIKSMKDWKETIPVPLGSTSIIIRANSTSPWEQHGSRMTRVCSQFIPSSPLPSHMRSTIPSHNPWRWGRLGSHRSPLRHSSSAFGTQMSGSHTGNTEARIQGR